MVVIQKNPGDLAGVALCLSVCYFQHVNVNKHSSSLGDWCVGKSQPIFFIKQIWKWLGQFYVLLPSCVCLKVLDLFVFNKVAGNFP